VRLFTEIQEKSRQLEVASQHKSQFLANMSAMTLGALPFYVLARVALGTSHSQASEWAFYVLTAAIAWLAGDSVRRAREYAQRLRAHAAAEAITAERLRISRELHDMVAHSLGIITLQAGAAARVIDTQPQSARNALYEVESAGREVLAGLRRMLGALRQPEPGQPGPDPGDQTVLGSMPGLADIERLAAATTAAGVRVDVRWRGERRPLPPDIDLAAYRIVQESVTNVVRHAGVRSCQVLITRDDKTLAVEIADRGPGRCGGSAGNRVRRQHGDRVRRQHGDRVRAGRNARASRPAARRVQRGAAARGRLPRDRPAAPAGPGDPDMTIRVVLADDQPLIRAALEMVIADTPDIEVVGQAGTGAEVAELTGELCPDVVVMDIRMPVMDGIEATRLIAGGSKPAARRRADHLRRRRVRLRRAARRGQRLPRQGHGAGGDSRRDQDRRRRRRPDLPRRHPAPDRRVRPAARTRHRTARDQRHHRARA